MPVYESLRNVAIIGSSGTNHSEAFQQWKCIRNRLAETIKDYVDACSALILACSQPAEPYPNRPTLDCTLLSLSNELPSLAQAEARLNTSRAKLTTLRNRSSSLSPISTLSPEILSRIFIMSSLSCVRTDSSHKSQQFLCPVVFASVCSSWHRTALATGRLWSHIDLAPNSDPTYRLYKRARVWTTRASDAPLHIHIHERACAKDDEISQLVSFLSPFMKRVCTLTINTECHSLDLFESTLACWLEHGRAGSMRTLDLRRPRPNPLLASFGPQVIRRLPREHLDEFLQPIQTLHLHNVCMGWSVSTAYRGLVELRVESLADVAGPTVSQLAAFLRGCPQLRRLKLARINFRYEEVEEDVVAPRVYLAHLEELNLLAVNSSVLRLLLPVLEIGARPLAMSVTLGAQPNIFEELSSFFGRTHVSKLYLDACHQDWVPLLFSSLGHLRTLVVSNYALLQNVYVESSPQVEPEAPEQPGICAQLRSLSLIGSDLSLEPLKNMLKAHPALDALNIWRCQLRTLDTELNKRANLAEIVRPILMRLVPQVTHSSSLKAYPMLEWFVSDEHSPSSTPMPL